MTELPYETKRSFFRRKLRIRFDCPRCSTGLTSSILEAGQPDSCPACGARFSAPGLKERRELERTETRKEVENQGDSSKGKENVESDPWAVEEAIRFTDPRIVFTCFGKGVPGWSVFVVLLPLLTPLFIIHLLAEVIFELLRDVTGDLFEGLDGVIVPLLGVLLGITVFALPVILCFLVFAEALVVVFSVLAGLSPFGLLVLYCCCHYLSQQKK